MALSLNKSRAGLAVELIMRVVAAAVLILICLLARAASDTEVSEAIRAAIESLPTSSQLEKQRISAPRRLAALYRRHDYQPQWSNRPRVDALLLAISASGTHGLRPDDYLPAFIREGLDRRTDDLSARQRAVFDIIVTDSLIRIGHDLRYGKANPGITVDDLADDETVDIDVVLRTASIVDAIDSLAPHTSQYRRLRQALDDYRGLADSDWPLIPPGPTIRPGDRDDRVEVLRRRLVASGDLGSTPTDDTNVYDAGLQDAVRRFQARHGLAVDSLIGRSTLRALNVPVDSRLQQLRVNLERLRWEARDAKDDEILVNVAAFEARLVRGGVTEWHSRAVVGDPENETPAICASLTHIVFNPIWTVPYRIAIDEMLPKMKRDSRFFDRGGYRLLDASGAPVSPSTVDWDAINRNNFPFTLEQRPGPLNQLGAIKFVFPNEYSVYMHDTPTRRLFDQANRAMSHGCVRIDEPLAFASQVLDSEGWSPSDIDAQLESIDTRTVSLRRPLPVRLVYRTAEVADDGAVHFYEDIYGRDGAVLTILDRPPL